MSQNCGAVGVFGLLLSEYDYLQPLVTEIRNFIERKQDELGVMSDEIVETNGFHEEWVPKIVAAFKAHGINVPEECHLFHTGSDTDRPAACETEADDFVLGWGMITSPWHWHESLGVDKWDETFRKAANFHTWVWQG